MTTRRLRACLRLLEPRLFSSWREPRCTSLTVLTLSWWVTSLLLALVPSSGYLLCGQRPDGGMAHSSGYQPIRTDGVRSPVLCGYVAGGTGFGLYWLGKELFSPRIGFWAIVAASVMPLFFVGASLMTIDTVYVFFWTWAAWAFWRAKEETRLRWWVLTGMLVGLGLLSDCTGQPLSFSPLPLFAFGIGRVAAIFGLLLFGL